MGILGMVRQKMARARQFREKYVDKKIVKKSEKLERAINLRQQTEKKAFIETELRKEKAQIREHRTAGLRRGIATLKSLKKKIPKSKGGGVYNQKTGVSLGPGTGTGPQFGLDKGKKSVFDITIKK